MRSLKDRLNSMELTEHGGFGDIALAREFGGVFYAAGPDQNRSKGSRASVAFTPEVAEEEERVAVGKFRHQPPIGLFVPIEEVSDEMCDRSTLV